MVQQEASQEKLCLSCLLSFLTEALFQQMVQQEASQEKQIKSNMNPILQMFY
jgi:hypothetical protein